MLKRILQLIVVLLMTTPGVMAQTVKVVSLTTAPGDIQVQVDMLNFDNVAAITLKLNYDSHLLEFNGVDNTNLNGDWVSNASGDVIYITYTASPLGSGFDINGKAFDMLFHYKGGFQANLDFDISECEIANSNLGIIDAEYLGGTVTQSEAFGMVSLTSLSAVVGSTVSMPVTIEGSGYSDVSGITFYINFDDAQVTFSGIIEDVLTGVTASASNGILKIHWSSEKSYDFSAETHLFDIQFVYNGGFAGIDFAPGCEIINSNLNPISTEYKNGSITAVQSTRSIVIAEVSALPGSIVGVPISADNFVDCNVGAITLNIVYDDSKLTYHNYTTQQLDGWVVNATNGGTISIVWSDSDGATLNNGALITLNFDFVGGFADIDFAPGSIISDVLGVTIPTNFINGKVGEGNGVSGRLLYDNDSNRPIGSGTISTTTVYLKDISTNQILYTTTTDVNGYFTFVGVLDGTYMLDATTTIDAKWSYDYFDAATVWYSFGTQPPLVGLEALAADVNQDGLDPNDAYLIYYSVSANNVKIPAWTAPDWIFEHPTVTVSGSAVNIDFSGIASGDADGNWTFSY
jgi:hypothetical protein